MVPILTILVSSKPGKVQGASDADLRLMRRIDEMHLKHPFYGSRRIRDWLQDEGFAVNRKRVQRLIRQMSITAHYPKANTSRPGKSHKQRFSRRRKAVVITRFRMRSSCPGTGPNRRCVSRWSMSFM